MIHCSTKSKYNTESAYEHSNDIIGLFSRKCITILIRNRSNFDNGEVVQEPGNDAGKWRDDDSAQNTDKLVLLRAEQIGSQTAHRRDRQPHYVLLPMAAVGSMLPFEPLFLQWLKCRKQFNWHRNGYRKQIGAFDEFSDELWVFVQNFEYVWFESVADAELAEDGSGGLEHNHYDHAQNNGEIEFLFVFFLYHVLHR